MPGRIVTTVLASLIVVATVGCEGVDVLRRPAQPAPTTEVRGSPTPQATVAPTAAGRAGAPATGAATAGMPLSVREVAERVRPAVVQIVTELARGRTDIFGLNAPQGPVTGVGSGVIFDPRGYILTNWHVVQGARSISVALPDGQTFDARLVGSDPTTDLAVLQVQATNLPTAPLGQSSTLAVGDPVVAIGNALGLPGGPTVTAGVVSALGRALPEPSDASGEPGALLYDLIQTDAAINPGNSGGPLVNLRGEVVGINTMVAAQAEPGVAAQGIGFAIAIDTARPIAEQIVTTGRVVHPYLGVLYQWAGGAAVRQRSGVAQPGVVVQRVVPGSPADRAGLRAGDIITRIDGQPLKQEADLPKAVRQHRVGDTVTLTVERDGREQQVSVQLAERPATS